jgi:predicted DNA-binding WGR domain protein
MSTRRFEMVEGSASKFWEVTENGASLTIRYGRIGTNGQTQEKSFADEAKASAAAAKLIAEKTGKGYVEVSADAPTTTTATKSADASDATASPKQAKAARTKATKAKAATSPDESTSDTESAPKAKAPKKSAANPADPAKKSAADPADRGKKPKAAAVEIPELELGGKTLGVRALKNAAERLDASTDSASFAEALNKLPGASYQARTVLAHLLAHGAFRPTQRLHVVGVVPTLFELAPDALLAVLARIPEETLAGSGQLLNQLAPLVGRLLRGAPDALREATLAPTLARLADLGRAVRGEPLLGDATGAIELASEMLPFGLGIAFDDEYGQARKVPPEALAETFARLAGPRWVRTFPNPERLPTATAVIALKDEPLEEAVRALCLFNKELLAARTEPAARFFELAAKAEGQKAEYLRIAGVAHAASPDEIPAGLEHQIRPIEVSRELGFRQLGTARLDAWAAHWLAQDEGLAPNDRQHTLSLQRLALGPLPFGDAMRARLIGEPQPYEHAADAIDVYTFVNEVRFLDRAAAADVLRVGAAMARRREEEEARPEITRGLRLLVCAAIAALPPEAEIDPSVDDLVRVSDGVDHESRELVRRTVHRLPLARSEKVVARSANELERPYEELTYAREGSSEAAMRRFARLLASGREDDMMWLNVRSGGLATLGPAFGPLLAEALEGETLSESFFANLERAIDPAAFAHVRAAVGSNVLDLEAELKKLADELGGERVVVYAMSVGKPSRSLSRLSRLPAGFTAEDVPRARGRKLMHAFTVDLHDVPELQARHPGARTLSVWIQGWGESEWRAQAIVPRTEEQIAAHPIAEDGPTLELLRLEVPASIFGPSPSERERYARGLLYRKPGLLLGGPIWLQDGKWGVDPTFVAQYDERIAIGANFGDVGIGYSFEDRATWQCH